MTPPRIALDMPEPPSPWRLAGRFAIEEHPLPDGRWSMYLLEGAGVGPPR